MAQSAISPHAAALAGIPSQPAPHPFEGIVSADASAWNEDVTRSRRYVTVADAERINAAHQEAEEPREHPAPVPPLTEAQRRPVYDEDGGYYATAPITTAVRDIDADDPHDGPFLEARIVLQPWDGQEHGRYTRIWVSYGASTGELTPAQARQVARRLGDFGVQLLALADHADTVAAAQEDPAGSFFRRHFPEVAAFLASERGEGR
ncbi:hypothetical protein [Streptomyces sp. PAM3C]|uniref:hypothetical protein n=1 Tax=Streptomyces sp. PAM3C TaxID=2847300 RepID=UPI001C1DF6A2|nr:hypothetical protein [Streptomyces sp. PAM3C]MBU5944900.1 hypothetical protein [Streptomyces sp. PAM3C]